MIGVDLEHIYKEEITVEIFPNRPDMMSEVGFGRALGSFFGVRKGLRKYNIKKSNEEVIVDKNLKDIRPYTAVAIVKNLKFDEEKIREVIQIQEKLHVTYGRNRKKCAIGVYPFENIRTPIRFKAMDKKDINFRPLDFKKELNVTEILEKHPTGKEYGYLLEKYDKYPVFIDANNNILSLTPVINSEYAGRVSTGTRDVFVEVSGHDFDVCKKCLNILVTALSDIGGDIYSMDLVYGSKKIVSPDLSPEKLKIDLKYMNKMLGLDLNESKIKSYLEKMGFDYKNKNVLIPSYRTDILHQIDIAEDIAIAYGYNNFKVEIPKISTIAEENSFEIFKSKLSNVLIGFGFIEVNSFSISNKEVLNKRMLVNNKIIELENALTSEYNVLRNLLLPSLLEVLERNRHNDYPQKIFEIGRVFVKDSKSETGIEEVNKLSLASCHAKADYTEVKQFLDSLISSLGLEASVEDRDNGTFIDGRSGSIFVNNKKIGFIGEVKPEVITNFHLDMPISGFEINLDELSKLI